MEQDLSAKVYGVRLAYPAARDAIGETSKTQFGKFGQWAGEGIKSIGLNILVDGLSIWASGEQVDPWFYAGSRAAGAVGGKLVGSVVAGYLGSVGAAAVSGFVGAAIVIVAEWAWDDYIHHQQLAKLTDVLTWSVRDDVYLSRSIIADMPTVAWLTLENKGHPLYGVRTLDWEPRHPEQGDTLSTFVQSSPAAWNIMPGTTWEILRLPSIESPLDLPCPYQKRIIGFTAYLGSDLSHEVNGLDGTIPYILFFPPILNTPATGETDPTVFRWNHELAYESCLLTGYRVEICRESDRFATSSWYFEDVPVETEEWTPQHPLEAGSYIWRVRANYKPNTAGWPPAWLEPWAHESSLYSEVRTFHVGPDSMPPRVIVSDPRPGSVDIPYLDKPILVTMSEPLLAFSVNDSTVHVSVAGFGDVPCNVRYFGADVSAPAIRVAPLSVHGWGAGSVVTLTLADTITDTHGNRLSRNAE
jgi:hypothetical protein